jgi:DNA invertase Pin-like site-specific DNA recombinase
MPLNEPGESQRDKQEGAKPIVAAEYLRMSTEHQNYSLLNQQSAIREYAMQNGFEVVRSYTDGGKSGLNITLRHGLLSLLRDVESGEARFDAVLVYDVSRWGRFQDPDESAFYEFSCRRAGISVHYCAEHFGDPRTPFSAIFKSVKRVMAGEYSRELSVKISEGRRRLVGQGYFQGGKPSLGLRRMCVDAAGNPKKLLRKGERKGFPTDRVILVPGPVSEQQMVREIFSMFAEKGMSPTAILNKLVADKAPPPQHSGWSRVVIRNILRNEVYIGNLVYNRSHSRLGMNKVLHVPGDWKRIEGAFEPIVSTEIFLAAQNIPFKKKKTSETDMIEGLRSLCLNNFEISAELINSDQNLISAASYSKRFGSLAEAYKRAGIDTLSISNHKKIVLHRDKLKETICEEIIQFLDSYGIEIEACEGSSEFNINKMYRLSLIVVPCVVSPELWPRWIIKIPNVDSVDFTLVTRLDQKNRRILDYLLLPSEAIETTQLSLTRHNGYEIECFAHESLEPIVQVLSSVDLAGAAQ